MDEAKKGISSESLAEQAKAKIPAEQAKTKIPVEPIKTKNPIEDTKVKETSRNKKLSTDELQYYVSTCVRFREEVANTMKLAIFLSAFVLLCCGLLTLTTFRTIFLDIALFFMGLAGLSFLSGSILSVISSGYLANFLITIKVKNLPTDKKQMLDYFQKGYIFKQSSTFLLLSGMAEIMLFVLCYLANFNGILAICAITVIIGLTYWLWEYRRTIEKVGGLKLPRKFIPIVEDEMSNVLSTNLPIDEKPKFEEKMILPAVQSLLKNTSSNVRKDAIRILGKIGTPEAIQILCTMVGDSVSSIRAQAIAALGRSGEKNVREILYCLLADESMEVRVATVSALGHLHDEDAGDGIIACLSDTTPEVRGAAAEALGNLRYKKGMSPLLQHLNDKDWFVRHNVIMALGKLKPHLSTESIQKLVDAIDDENSEVRVITAHVLQKIQEDMSQNDPLYIEIQTALKKANPVNDDTPQEIPKIENTKPETSKTEPAKIKITSKLNVISPSEKEAHSEKITEQKKEDSNVEPKKEDSNNVELKPNDATVVLSPAQKKENSENLSKGERSAEICKQETVSVPQPEITNTLENTLGIKEKEKENKTPIEPNESNPNN